MKGINYQSGNQIHVHKFGSVVIRCNYFSAPEKSVIHYSPHYLSQSSVLVCIQQNPSFIHSSACLIDYLSFFILFHILFSFICIYTYIFRPPAAVDGSEFVLSVACGVTLMLSLSGLSVCSFIDLQLRH